MSDAVVPVKRGPGRPRKVPLPVPTPDDSSDYRIKHDQPEPSKSDPEDPRIGQPCDPGWSGVGFGDGSSYRCEGGFIVERLAL